MLIEGGPGIGKTLWSGACAEAAAGCGCLVFWGSGDELGQARPLLPILEVCESVRVQWHGCPPARGA